MITRYAIQVKRVGEKTWDWFNNNMTAYSFATLTEAREFVKVWSESQKGTKFQKGIRVVKLEILVKVMD